MRDGIIKSSGDQRGPKVRPPMGECEQERNRAEGAPLEFPKRNMGEVLIDEVPEQKTPPENLLEEGHDNDQPRPSQCHVREGQGTCRPKKRGIETVAARFEAEPFLGCDPNGEDEHRYPGGEE